METNNFKTISDKYIDSKMDELWSISKYIHENPELCFEEYKASKIQCEYLEKYGFKVERGVGGLETSFKATYHKKNKSPVITVISEYDALPIGHACGHNLIATSAIGTAIAAKKFLEENDIDGSISIIGTPAEESGGGKIILLENGVFEDSDIVLMMHPTSYTHRIAGECLSSNRFRVEFIGKSAHAQAHPDNGVNALSTASLFITATAFLRQHFKSDVRLSCIIEEGGTVTSLIPDKSIVVGSIASLSLTDLNSITEKIETCAKGCAMSLGCETNITIKNGYQGRVPNKTLSDICKKEIMAINESVMDNMPMDYGGEDLGNVSRFIPICSPYISIFKDYKISNHTEQFKNLSISESGFNCVKVASKIMARTFIELLNNKHYIKQAKDELEERLKLDNI